MARFRLPQVLLSTIAALWLLAAPAPAQDPESPGLQDQVRALAAAEGFAVTGLERLGDAAAKTGAGGPPIRQLERLLGGYNYVVLHDRAGRIAEVRISGLRAKAPAVPRRHVVSTERRRGHHLVEAELTGPKGRRRMALIVDTGATTVVLPSSMIEVLGFDAEDLAAASADTAGGRVAVRIGRLARVRIGQAQVADVEVAFIADDKIGDQALLGMSFLEHFRVTLEESRDRIILRPK